MYKLCLNLERRLFAEIAKLSPLPVIVRHLEYSADDGVARCRSRSCTG